MFLVFVYCCVRFFREIIFGEVIFLRTPQPANPRPHDFFSQKIIKIEVPRPRDHAHRVERKKLILETGGKFPVGVIKVGFVEKQVFG